MSVEFNVKGDGMLIRWTIVFRLIKNFNKRRYTLTEDTIITQIFSTLPLLSLAGPFTVFAPTNAAFDALPAGVKAALSKDANLLKQVLEFHVVDGRTYSTQLSNDMMVPTEAEGLDVRVNVYGKVRFYH